MAFRGTSTGKIEISVDAIVTRHASEGARDAYTLNFSRGRIGGTEKSVLTREEEFRFKRTAGSGRRLTINGRRFTIYDEQSRTKRLAPKKDDIPERVRRVADVVKAERIRNEVGCIFVHEDCDRVEPAHEEDAAKLEKALEDVGCDAHAVTPAWEMEAWWFLWPDAVKDANPSWRKPDDYVGKSVGLIQNAKEELMRRVIPPGVKLGRSGFRGYQESDSPRIALRVRERGLVDKPEAKSGSYDRFRRSARLCKA